MLSAVYCSVVKVMGFNFSLVIVKVTLLVSF